MLSATEAVDVQGPSADAPSTALYCYGVTWSASAQPQRAAGIGGEPVEPVCHREIAALTSHVESTKIRARRRDLLSHSQVLSTAVQQGTVLPLRFGVGFQSGPDLVESFLRPRHDELTALLRKFEGRVELSVKAFYREESILAEIVRDNPRIARLREATRRQNDASTYPLRLELGERTAREIQRRTHVDRQAILGRLRPLAVDVQVDDDPIEHQVLRASFLVEAGAVAAFDRAMNELAEEQAARMHFKYLGPLAPHSFVNVTPTERR